MLTIEPAMMTALSPVIHVHHPLINLLASTRLLLVPLITIGFFCLYKPIYRWLYRFGEKLAKPHATVPCTFMFPISSCLPLSPSLEIYSLNLLMACAGANYWTRNQVNCQDYGVMGARKTNQAIRNLIGVSPCISTRVSYTGLPTATKACPVPVPSGQVVSGHQGRVLISHIDSRMNLKDARRCRRPRDTRCPRPNDLPSSMWSTQLATIKNSFTIN